MSNPEKKPIDCSQVIRNMRGCGLLESDQIAQSLSDADRASVVALYLAGKPDEIEKILYPIEEIADDEIEAT